MSVSFSEKADPAERRGRSDSNSPSRNECKQQCISEGNTKRRGCIPRRVSSTGHIAVPPPRSPGSDREEAFENDVHGRRPPDTSAGGSTLPWEAWVRQSMQIGKNELAEPAAVVNAVVNSDYSSDTRTSPTTTTMCTTEDTCTMNYSTDTGAEEDANFSLNSWNEFITEQEQELGDRVLSPLRGGGGGGGDSSSSERKYTGPSGLRHEPTASEPPSLKDPDLVVSWSELPRIVPGSGSGSGSGSPSSSSPPHPSPSSSSSSSPSSSSSSLSRSKKSTSVFSRSGRKKKRASTTTGQAVPPDITPPLFCSKSAGHIPSNHTRDSPRGSPTLSSVAEDDMWDIGELDGGEGEMFRGRILMNDTGYDVPSDGESPPPSPQQQRHRKSPAIIGEVNPPLPSSSSHKKHSGKGSRRKRDGLSSSSSSVPTTSMRESGSSTRAKGTSSPQRSSDPSQWEDNKSSKGSPSPSRKGSGSHSKRRHKRSAVNGRSSSPGASPASSPSSSSSVSIPSPIAKSSSSSVSSSVSSLASNSFPSSSSSAPVGGAPKLLSIMDFLNMTPLNPSPRSSSASNTPAIAPNAAPLASVSMPGSPSSPWCSPTTDGKHPAKPRNELSMMEFLAMEGSDSTGTNIAMMGDDTAGGRGALSMSLQPTASSSMSSSGSTRLRGLSLSGEQRVINDQDRLEREKRRHRRRNAEKQRKEREKEERAREKHFRRVFRSTGKPKSLTVLLNSIETLLFRENYAVVTALLEHRLAENDEDVGGEDDTETVFSATAALFLAKGQILHLMQRSFSSELDSIQKEQKDGGVDGEATLFRSESVSTKLLSQLFKLEGIEYLKDVVRPLVKSILALSHDMLKFDPTRDTDCEANLKRTDQFILIVNTFLGKLFTTIDQCPYHIRAIFGFISDEVSSRFGANAQGIVLSVFFLRFLCPPVVNPERYNLEKENKVADKRRSLIRFAKFIQTLANGQLIEPASDTCSGMVGKLNAFIKQNVDAISAYFDVLVDPVRLTTLSIIPKKPHSVRSDQIGVIRNLMLCHRTLISDVLADIDDPSANEAFDTFVAVSTLSAEEWAQRQENIERQRLLHGGASLPSMPVVAMTSKERARFERDTDFDSSPDNQQRRATSISNGSPEVSGSANDDDDQSDGGGMSFLDFLNNTEPPAPSVPESPRSGASGKISLRQAKRGWMTRLRSSSSAASSAPSSSSPPSGNNLSGTLGNSATRTSLGSTPFVSDAQPVTTGNRDKLRRSASRSDVITSEEESFSGPARARSRSNSLHPPLRNNNAAIAKEAVRAACSLQTTSTSILPMSQPADALAEAGSATIRRPKQRRGSVIEQKSKRSQDRGRRISSSDDADRGGAESMAPASNVPSSPVGGALRSKSMYTMNSPVSSSPSTKKEAAAAAAAAALVAAAISRPGFHDDDDDDHHHHHHLGHRGMVQNRTNRSQSVDIPAQLRSLLFGPELSQIRVIRRPGTTKSNSSVSPSLSTTATKVPPVALRDFLCSSALSSLVVPDVVDSWSTSPRSNAGLTLRDYFDHSMAADGLCRTCWNANSSSSIRSGGDGVATNGGDGVAGGICKACGGDLVPDRGGHDGSDDEGGGGGVRSRSSSDGSSWQAIEMKHHYAAITSVTARLNHKLRGGSGSGLVKSADAVNNGPFAPDGIASPLAFLCSSQIGDYLVCSDSYDPDDRVSLTSSAGTVPTEGRVLSLRNFLATSALGDLVVPVPVSLLTSIEEEGEEGDTDHGKEADPKTAVLSRFGVSSKRMSSSSLSSSASGNSADDTIDSPLSLGSLLQLNACDVEPHHDQGASRSLAELVSYSPQITPASSSTMIFTDIG